MWKMQIMTSNVTSKTDEIRARTDRQLIQLIERDLDRALQADECAAENAYRTARKLFTVAYGATSAERRRVETKLAAVAGHSTAIYASVA